MEKNLDCYDELTEAQRLRDEAFINAVRKKYVAPLVAELDAAVDGYSKMIPYDRFLALMRLNEEHAPNGESLLLEFGYVGGGVDENGVPYADASLTTRGLVFSGIQLNYHCEMRNGVPVYSKAICCPHPIGTDGDILSILDGYAYDNLPLAFRVALIALYVRQNVFTTNANACCFAAGIRNDVELRRFFVDRIRTESGELLGWDVMLRDARPENDLMKSLGRMMRESANRNIETQRIAESEKAKSRKRRDTTETLIAFIDEVLPSRGMRVGRVGISWKKAFQYFEEIHPGMYKNPKSFENAYHNAKRQERLNREGR